MPFSKNGCKCKCFGYTFANAFELISNVWFFIDVLFYLEKKKTNLYKHIIHFINTVVHYCNH